MVGKYIDVYIIYIYIYIYILNFLSERKVRLQNKY